MSAYGLARTFFSLFAAAAMVVPPAAAQKEKDGQPEKRGDDPQVLERLRLLRALREAPPMRMPEWKPGLPLVTPPGSLIRYDRATGQVTFVPARENAVPGLRREPGRRAPRPLSLEGLARDLLPGRRPGSSPSLTEAATPPGPYAWPYDYPWNTHVKIVAHFTWGGAEYYGSCSASMAASFHAVTAGHCIYARDLNNDGNAADSVWADQIWLWPGHTDVVEPKVMNPNGTYNANGTPDYPYGVAMGVYWETYTAWIDSGDLNWDIGWITLDRRLGNYTGWMGRETNTEVGALNYNGYPVEEPYVRWYDPFQYPDFESVTGYSSNRINMAAYTWGGHSGGPVWRYDGANDYLQGVNSTSDRAGSASAARLTNTSFDHLAQRISADETGMPPVARPDLIEWVFDTSSKGLLTNTVALGSSFSVRYNVFNVGFADAGSVTVDFYLSTDPVISAWDYYVGSAYPGALGAYTYTVPTATLTAPTNVPPGTYYVGYIMSASVAEYGTGDNTVVIPNETLTATCNADAYEYDDASGWAKTIVAGSTQTHSICPATDQDWAIFTLASPSAVTLQTGGVSGDTRMWLFDSSLTQLDYNDDYGSTYFSRIDRTCGVNELPAGTYYVKVDEYLNNNVIPSYTLSLTATACAPPVSVAGLTLSPASVVGGASSTGTVTLSVPAPPGGSTVTLASANPLVASVPGSVTVAAGAASAAFAVNTTAVASSTTVSITAALGGSVAAPLTVKPPSLTSVTLSPATVPGGLNSTGKVTLNGMAPAGGALVALATSNASLASPPVNVTVAAGSKTATFTIATQPVSVVSSADISGTYKGVTRTAKLTLNPPKPSSVTFLPASVTGGSSSTGKVTLDTTAPPGGIVVALASANTAAVTVPATATIAAGATSANFTATTHPVAAATTVAVSATANGTAKSGNLTVNPPKLSTLTLTPATVKGGVSSTGKVTLTGKAPPGGIAVALSSNNAAVNTPASTTVPAGATSKSFAVTTTVVATTTTAKISAAQGGVTKSANLTVTP